MRSLFDKNTFEEVKTRLNKLDENTQAQWGKMTVGQMTLHCQGPLNIMLEKNDYRLKPNYFAKVFFKKSLYNNKPWRKNLPTAKFLKAKEEKNFSTETEKLTALVDEVYARRNQQEWKEHPAFGYFTKGQLGQMQFKHLNHHLTQFGV